MIDSFLSIPLFLERARTVEHRLEFAAVLMLAYRLQIVCEIIAPYAPHFLFHLADYLAPFTLRLETEPIASQTDKSTVIGADTDASHHIRRQNSTSILRLHTSIDQFMVRIFNGFHRVVPEVSLLDSLHGWSADDVHILYFGESH